MKRRRLPHGSGLILAGALGSCASAGSRRETQSRTENPSGTETGTESPTGTSAPTGEGQKTTRAAVDQSIYISEVRPNPTGPDAEALNREYVLVETTGNAAADLSGYTLAYGERDEYVFPETVSAMTGGANLEIHTGHGTDSVDTASPPTYSLFVGSDAPLLANDGMRLAVRDRAGATVDHVEYWSMEEGSLYVRPET
jgi:competence protein ComEC